MFKVDEAFIISLPARTDRLQKLAAAITHEWPFPAPELHPGVCEERPPWFRNGNGAWGCRQAHLQLLHSAWERGIDSTLILEDDAAFVPHFAWQWDQVAPRIPTGWDMVMLGGQHIATPERVNDHVSRCVNTRRTHAYIVRLKAIPLLIRTWEACRTHIDHKLVDFQAAARVYAAEPFLIGQDAGISDITYKENPLRFWT